MDNRSSLSPCKDCGDRYLGCHSDCERYKSYKEENRERRMRKVNDLEKRGVIYEAVKRRKRH